jgi:non-ribosomal peptide synthetase component F
MQVLLADFIRAYGGEELIPPSLQYQDYAVWEQEGDGSRLLQRTSRYWLDLFPEPLPRLNLPLDYPRPLVPTFVGRAHLFLIDQDTTAALRTFAQQNGVTMYAASLAAFAVLLAHVSGEWDIVVGSPATGRIHPELQTTFGMFVTTLLLRLQPKATESYAAFVRSTAQVATAALSNQPCPLPEIAQRLEPNRDMSRNALFDVMFEWQDGEDQDESEDILVRAHRFEATTSKFDLKLHMHERGDGLTCTLEYRTALFLPDRIRRWGEDLVAIFASVTANPNTCLCDIELAGKAGMAKLLEEFNDAL